MQEQHEIISETLATKNFTEMVQYHNEWGRTETIEPTEMIRFTGICRLCGHQVSDRVLAVEYTKKKALKVLTDKHKKEMFKSVKPAAEAAENG